MLLNSKNSFVTKTGYDILLVHFYVVEAITIEWKFLISYSLFPNDPILERDPNKQKITQMISILINIKINFENYGILKFVNIDNFTFWELKN